MNGRLCIAAFALDDSLLNAMSMARAHWVIPDLRIPSKMQDCSSTSRSEFAV